ncbi:hypothetical protein [Microbacterium sp. bgisy203]|uniref:hypothetical protein n=1 Tax=Microbacterium sp. bgisy203 TaxID=3413799 RepID=UPI003D75EB86
MGMMLPNELIWVMEKLGFEWPDIDEDELRRGARIIATFSGELDGLRIPTGNEAGANDHWIPGGYLPTGIREAVIDVPSTATGVGGNLDGDYNPGMWPGTAQSVEL